MGMNSIKNSGLTYRFLTWLLFNDVFRSRLIKILKKIVSSSLKADKKNRFSNQTPRIQREKTLMVDSILHSMENSIKKGTIKKNVLNSVLKLWGSSLATPRQDKPELKKFYDKNGFYPPWLLVISPGHFCNLKCKDCYASSGTKDSKLDWDVLDKLIKDAKKKWGIGLVVFSGGEPFAYQSQGKGIMDIVKENPDCLFLSFTNGTLIDDNIISELSECKNLTPAFSVEGFQEVTDRRRGKGIFNKLLGSMASMRDAGLPFGISVTVNKNNCMEVLEDKFLDFFFNKQDAFYCFYFQYLPIGRNADFDLMPDASQRASFYHKIWSQIEKNRYFLLDFWNHGTWDPGKRLYSGWKGRRLFLCRLER
jgi:sulfatase maturation enzyme AslB (radical SAM superfamily)